MGIALSPSSAIAGVLRDGHEPTTKAEFDALMSRFVDSRAGSFTCIRTLDSADGPFYYERSEMRRSIAEDRSGMALRLGINLVQIFLRADMCAPLSGAVVDLWLADGAGQYSNVGGDLQNENTVGKTFLRGHQITDANGNVEFDLIPPRMGTGGRPAAHQCRQTAAAHPCEGVPRKQGSHHSAVLCRSVHGPAVCGSRAIQNERVDDVSRRVGVPAAYT